MMTKVSVLIYQDYLHNNGGLYTALRDRFGRLQIDYADAADIIQGVLTPNVRLFVMPGGASRYVADKLNGSGNILIRDYVAQGGFYLGVCAGAYYACCHTEWRTGKADEIITSNELKLFPGTAIGPISSFVREAPDGSYTTAQLTTLRTEVGAVYPCLYWGGPVFSSDEPENGASWRVLARYNDALVDGNAVIFGSHGEGHYLLLSPHLELDKSTLNMMRFSVRNDAYAELSALAADKLLSLSREYFFQLLQNVPI